ncbi:beta-propeller fold lactonase family protein [Mesorhizobium sp. VNQ89]|uniref:beta-propeller fold lactonase family protein n=1 Tax=Mesorhizobium quangtriensis TaxID=3157709 RepID=UPI0032B70153
MVEIPAEVRASRVELQCNESVASAIAGIGRTEDIRFSPNNNCLAIAGFAKNKLLCLKVEIQADARGPSVSAHSFMEITSDGIEDAHGLDFIDDKTLAVANRNADVAIVRLPELWNENCHGTAKVLRRISGPRWRRISSPGSLVVTHSPFAQLRLLVCNNYARRVTEHMVSPLLGYISWKNRPLLREGLHIPDGIAVSPDGRWIAVSSHGTNDVKIFDGSTRLDKRAKPAAVLMNAGYPHGLRFTKDGQFIIVADAGRPTVNVYRGRDGWTGEYPPLKTITVLDEETYLRGRNNPLEGGPKGLDIDKSGRVLAITCEEEPLALFSLQCVLAGSVTSPATPAVIGAALRD